jgi:hypothetical protein
MRLHLMTSKKLPSGFRTLTGWQSIYHYPVCRFWRAIQVSAFRRFVKLAKVMACLSAAMTVVCAAVLEWISRDAVDAYRVSSAVRLLKDDANKTYVAASLNSAADKLRGAPGANDWLLELPAVAVLLAIASVFILFYLSLAVLEKREFGK